MEKDRETGYRYCLNWHYILFGPVFYTILLFLLYRAANGGGFGNLSETIHRLAHLGASDSDAVEAFCGLFSVGYVVNVLISCSKFKGKRIHALGIQILGLLALTIAVAVFLWIISSIIKIVGFILILALIWKVGNRMRTRGDALSDLAYSIKESEDRLTSEQKRAIEQRALSAVLDMSRDEHDTKDIDDIITEFGL